MYTDYIVTKKSIPKILKQTSKKEPSKLRMQLVGVAV